MYAETGIMLPYFHDFSQQPHQFDDLCCSQNPNASLGIQSSQIQTSTISDYNLGGEAELFKAPEPVLGEPLTSVDPVMAAISMISCGEDVLSPQSLTVSNIESSIESGQLLSEIFYEYQKDLLAKQGNEKPFSQPLSFQIPTDENFSLVFEKSVSSSCLRSMGSPLRPRFADFTDMELGAYSGMRRAFSEGDIKILDNDNNISVRQSWMEQHRIMSRCTSEDRWDKLCRYWNKKSKRNFGRKIKYACRKALADNQPRIRGRFAKTEELDTSKML